VTAAAVAKLLDFGVAKARGAMEKTRTGVVKGTYAYSAPEQLRGEQVDPRADVFGLGIVAWEAVAGRRLFRRDTDFLVFRAITDDPIPNVLDVRPDVPEQLAQVIERALSRDRDGRFDTARELGAAIGDSLRAIGPPLSSVAVATLFESAFANELAEQRRLCGMVDEEYETLDAARPADRYSDPSITRPFDTNHVARIVGALPLTADTEEMPALFDGFGDDGAPDFEVTPVDDGITYSAMTPMPQLGKRDAASGAARDDERDEGGAGEDAGPGRVAPIGELSDGGARAEEADAEASGREPSVADPPVDLLTESASPLRPAIGGLAVRLLVLACVAVVGGIAYLLLRSGGPHTGDRAEPAPSAGLERAPADRPEAAVQSAAECRDWRRPGRRRTAP